MKVGCVIIVLLLFFRCKPVEEENLPKPLITGMEGKSIPSELRIITKDSFSMIDFKNVNVYKSFVFIYFSPTCPYSRAQIEEVVANISQYKDTRFVFLSPYSIKEVNIISDEFHLKDFKNIIIGEDYKQQFRQFYKIEGVPFVAVYDKNKRLVSAYGGLVKIYSFKDQL